VATGPAFYCLLFKRIDESVESTGKPVVLVLMTGVPSHCPGVSKYSCYYQRRYGGQSAGTAIAEVLFGECNPAGGYPSRSTRVIRTPIFSDYSMNNRTAISKETFVWIWIRIKLYQFYMTN
jgi:beta-glucosidase